MKLTKRQLRQVIRESYDMPKFQFSINPLDYISGELDFEGLHTMIELILDGDNINYHSFDRSYDIQLHNDVVYEFGYTLQEEPDPKSYQAFIALIEALQRSGVPTYFETVKSRNFKVPSYMFHDYPLTPDNPLPFSHGTLRLKAPRKAQRGSVK